MRPHRGFLFWGIFFTVLGAIVLADRQGWIDASQWREIGRLWPLIIIAVGVLILLSRTQIALVGTIAAAFILGGLAGAGLAGGTGFFAGMGDCVPGGSQTFEHTAESGSLSGPASVELELNCGSLNLAAAEGEGWSVDASYRGAAPQISATGTSLAVRTPENGSRRQEWEVSVPANRLERVGLQSNAADVTLDLTGSELAGLNLEANAGDMSVIAEAGSIRGLDLSMNAGRARLTLGGSVESGHLSVNAGAIDLCVPTSAELTLDVAEQLTFATNLEESDLTKNGTVWQRAGSGGPAIDLSIEGNAASFNLNPSGDCR